MKFYKLIRNKLNFTEGRMVKYVPVFAAFFRIFYLHHDKDLVCPPERITHLVMDLDILMALGQKVAEDGFNF